MDVDTFSVNGVSADDNLFAMPDLPGHRYLDLANPADMQGIQLLGPTAAVDVYDNRSPVDAPGPVRAAWQRLASLPARWR